MFDHVMSRNQLVWDLTCCCCSLVSYFCHELNILIICRTTQESLYTSGGFSMDMQAQAPPSWRPSFFTGSSETVWEKSTTCWRTPALHPPSAWPRTAARTRRTRRKGLHQNQTTRTRSVIPQCVFTWRRSSVWKAW